MELARSRADLRACIDAWQADGLRVALVPTMGNLHAGHHALVARAAALADKVVVSVFVNPAQFAPGEDYERYPRTLDADAEGLRDQRCDLLFAPSMDAIYPFGTAYGCRLQVPALTEVLCGAHRPGHFDGVAGVVSRLFILVRPALAVFGEKDFQQLRILERMTEDLGHPVAIERAATVRAPDGLALSSRNRYLDPDQRQRAPLLLATLQEIARGWSAGAAPTALLERNRQALEEAGFQVDYLDIRREDGLDLAQPGDCEPVRVFVAARLGQTRLIDNLPCRERQQHTET